ncbi:MAG: hypothetical protein QOJ26_1911 [Thermoplasmata archaeon]|jgi:hypothetical protein|nr:hypothetical protein [Thermoplasmata archaeon]MEA3167027.1 hypothetical protein [Thermoplasmata archaeon]
MPWWLIVVATVALVLAAAKAHGRQIRLEREQQGYFRVDFRSQNPAAVEAIWRTDRRVFWPAFAALALAALVLVALLWSILGAQYGVAAAAFGLACAFAGAFVVAGLVSWIRMAGRDQGPLPWRRRAMVGSAGWWLAVAAAATLLALAVRF